MGQIAAVNSNLTGSADILKNQSVFYVGPENNIYWLGFNNVYWFQYDLRKKMNAPFPRSIVGTPRGGSPLTSTSSTLFPYPYAVYFDNDSPSHIQQLFPVNYQTFDLTLQSNTLSSHPPAQNSPLLTYYWNGQKSQHVFYVDNNNQVIELYSPYATQPLGKFEVNDLSIHSGYTESNTPMNGSPLVGYVFENEGTEHVFYIANDNTIRELYYSGAWYGNNLSEVTGALATPPKVNSPLAAYVQEFDNTQHVIYIDNQNHVHELYWSGGAWHNGLPDLTQTTGTPQPAGNSDLAGYACEYERTEHVIYIGNDGHIHELWNGGTWNTTDLTDKAGSGATAPMNGTPLAGYSDEAEQTHHVFYIDVNYNVHELYRSGNAWFSGAVSGNIPVD
jgi:hypothetical protein